MDGGAPLVSGVEPPTDVAHSELRAMRLGVDTLRGVAQHGDAGGHDWRGETASESVAVSIRGGDLPVLVRRVRAGGVG